MRQIHSTDLIKHERVDWIKKAAPRGHCILHFGEMKILALVDRAAWIWVPKHVIKILPKYYPKSRNKSAEMLRLPKMSSVSFEKSTIPHHSYPNKQFFYIRVNRTVQDSEVEWPINRLPHHQLSTQHQTQTKPTLPRTPLPYHTSPSNSPIPAHLDLRHYSNMILMRSILVKNFALSFTFWRFRFGLLTQT